MGLGYSLFPATGDRWGAAAVAGAYDPWGATTGAGAYDPWGATAGAAGRGYDPVQDTIDAANAAAAAAGNQRSPSLLDYATLAAPLALFPLSIPIALAEALRQNGLPVTTEGLEEMAKKPGDAAMDALKWLAANGNMFAKLALAFGVSLGIAQAIAIAGGGLLLVLFLKK